jgi:hypothetical protein
MVSFECSFEVCTRQEAVWVLQEMISQIEGDNYCGYFSYADGSWSSRGEEESEEDF